MQFVAQDYRDAEIARPEVFPPAPARNPDATIRAMRQAAPGTSELVQSGQTWEYPV